MVSRQLETAWQEEAPKGASPQLVATPRQEETQAAGHMAGLSHQQAMQGLPLPPHSQCPLLHPAPHLLPERRQRLV